MAWTWLCWTSHRARHHEASTCFSQSSPSWFPPVSEMLRSTWESIRKAGAAATPPPMLSGESLAVLPCLQETGKGPQDMATHRQVAQEGTWADFCVSPLSWYQSWGPSGSCPVVPRPRRGRTGCRCGPSCRHTGRCHSCCRHPRQALWAGPPAFSGHRLIEWPPPASAV